MYSTRYPSLISEGLPLDDKIVCGVLPSADLVEQRPDPVFVAGPPGIERDQAGLRPVPPGTVRRGH